MGGMGSTVHYAQGEIEHVLSLGVATVGGLDIAAYIVNDVAAVAPRSRRTFAQQVVALERQLDGGPITKALDEARTVRADDLATDIRWPRFGEATTALGVRSVLVLPLPAVPGGAITLYGHDPHAFDEDAEAHALLLCALVEKVLLSGDVRSAQQRIVNLQAAVASRELIGQAQGILMERAAITSDQAFAHLRRASQSLNVKLTDVAARLVETGEDPLARVDPSIVPANEAMRSDAVRRYDVLDTPPDGSFDRIARLAARACGTPIGIVSIVDHDRIWFKSHHGTEATQIGRDPGLCASAILQDGPWIVEDAATDPRTLTNPLVAGDFGLRFYLGVPLKTHDGYNLGTLCVLDHHPRTARDAEVADLVDLAQLVIDELELRLAARRAIVLEAGLRRQAETHAVELRAGLKPAALPDLPNLDLFAVYVPAQREHIGGDFYDAFGAEASYGLLIGDVSGHGSPASALSTMARHTVRAVATGDWSPRGVLERLNEAIARASEDQHRFCTAAVARLEPTGDRMTVTLAIGGHPRPLVLRADGVVDAIGAPGPLVGPFADSVYEDDITHLSAGDSLILYTDGLVDAVDSFDEDALRAALPALCGRPADEIASTLVEAVRALAPYPRDDIAVVVAKFSP